MRNARDIMFKIGKIVNYVLIGLGALFFILGIVGLILGAADSESALVASGGSLLGYGIVLLITNLVVLFLAGKANDIIFNGQDNVIKGSVFLIILGVVSENIFFILAGIFSILCKDEIDKEGKKDKDVQEAEVVATVEDEPFENAETVTEDGEEVVAEEVKDEE